MTVVNLYTVSVSGASIAVKGLNPTVKSEDMPTTFRVIAATFEQACKIGAELGKVKSVSLQGEAYADEEDTNGQN